MSGFQNSGIPPRDLDDASDVAEEVLAADYREQVSYQDDDFEGGLSMAQQTDDIQSRLAAAAQPLDFSASLEVKFQSYDSYCSLFHFILNSDGPVDLEPPSVRSSKFHQQDRELMLRAIVLLGMGCHRRIYLPVQQLLLLQEQGCATGQQRRGSPTSSRQPQHLGLLQRAERPVLSYPAIPDQ